MTFPKIFVKFMLLNIYSLKADFLTESHNWFKCYYNIKGWIANGWVLPSGLIPLRRVCYQHSYPV